MRRTHLPWLLVTTLLVGCGDHTLPETSHTPSGHQRPSRLPTARPTLGSKSVPSRATARHTAWHLPYAVAREAAVRTNGTAVTIAGGLVPGDLTTSRAVQLDLTSGRVRPLPPLPVAVHDSAAGLIAGRPTVVGGGNSSEQSVVQELDRRVWHRLGRLPSTRSDLNVVSWRRTAVVLGGYDGASEPKTILRLGPHGTARPIGKLIRGVRYAATARIGSRVYVIGGEVAGQELDTIQVVDLANGHTRTIGHLPVSLGHAMAAAAGGRILVMGGRTTPTCQTKAMWWYDPATRQFHRAGQLPAPLSDAAVITHGHRIWLLGGETPDITNAVTTVMVR